MDARPLILIADDDAAVRSAIGRLLARSGYDVAEAGDGDAALAAVEARLPDLIILDILMPGRDGIETLLELRRHHHDLPIVVASGGDRKGWRGALDDALALGATAAIGKPFESAELLNTVRACLGR